MSEQPVRIFVSYSHADAGYLAEGSLLGFLRGLEREGAEFWSDERIAAGERWDEEIRARIAATDVALVLVSQSFLDSEYCTSVEVVGFLDRRRESGMVIFPVVLSPCEWERHAWLRSNLATTLWFMGYPERAQARGDEALALARELAHPYSLCFTLYFCVWQYLFRREVEMVGELAAEMLAVSRQQSFSLWETMGIILEGWVECRRGDTAAGLAAIEGGTAKWRALGARLFVPSFLCLIASVHLETGEVEAGLAVSSCGRPSA